MDLTYEAIAGRIDHALLMPTMTDVEMAEGCKMAARYEVASVCIKPSAIPLAVKWLSGSSVMVGTVVGFPHGGQTIAAKQYEMLEAIESGAAEIDMVVNIGQVMSGRWDLIEAEIFRLTKECHERSRIIKVIFETCYLTDEQKIKLCEICGRANVDFVKTSTGFGTAGATAADIILFRQHSPKTVDVKASGGIRTLDDALKFVELGAGRLGLSRTAEILEELIGRLNLPSRSVARETQRKSSETDPNY